MSDFPEVRVGSLTNLALHHRPPSQWIQLHTMQLLPTWSSLAKGLEMH